MANEIGISVKLLTTFIGPSTGRHPWRNRREAPPPQLPLGLRLLRRAGIPCQPRATAAAAPRTRKAIKCEKGLEREASGRKGSRGEIEDLNG